MKTIFNYIIFGGLFLGFLGCQDDFIDLEPPAQFTDAAYFKKPGDFKDFTTSFYNRLQGWSFGNMDNGTDLSANANGNGTSLGHGTIAVGGTSWDYSGIRNCNILLAQAAEYTGTGNIDQYTGEAHFFRAYIYFNLLRTFGGVPLITTVLDVDSPELFGPRNSRYEVVSQILADLDEAISKLPNDQNIPSTDKGRVGKWGAMALKAQVELYEATWEKYVGTSADGDGTTEGAGSVMPSEYPSVNAMLQDAVTMCEEVMNSGGYELWNKNTDPDMENLSSWYLFNLEDEGSNPGGYDKSTNKEFILYKVYDFNLKQSGQNITWTSWQLYPSRKFVDMAVCTDGLPPSKSPLFQGYGTTGAEFENRDLRLLNYLYASTEAPQSVTLEYGGRGFSGYGNSKYAVYGFGDRRKDNEESANWPILRLAEVYLIYAEALYELNGSITDAQLDASINKLRDRAEVAHLTNTLVAENGLDMLQEIRRERAVELYREGKRFDDLKRWGMLEEALNPSRLGRVVGSASYPTDFVDESGNPTEAYDANSYLWGEEAVETPEGVLNCVVVDSKLNHTVEKKHYLWPIPMNQMALNDSLLQNPGY